MDSRTIDFINNVCAKTPAATPGAMTRMHPLLPSSQLWLLYSLEGSVACTHARTQTNAMNEADESTTAYADFEELSDRSIDPYACVKWLRNIKSGLFPIIIVHEKKRTVELKPSHYVLHLSCI
jgi:hypothetical protein